jgi:hypothetical protein
VNFASFVDEHPCNEFCEYFGIAGLFTVESASDSPGASADRPINLVDKVDNNVRRKGKGRSMSRMAVDMELSS